MEPISFTLTQPSPGYSFPNVDFDLPDDPNGIQATGHALCVAPQTDCTPAAAGSTVTVTGIQVDQPGSGYTSAPGFAVLDGTQFNPVTHNTPGWTMATGTATLQIASIVVDTPGTGYTSTPTVAIADTPPEGFPADTGRSRRPRPTRARSAG